MEINGKRALEKVEKSYREKIVPLMTGSLFVTGSIYELDVPDPCIERVEFCFSEGESENIWATRERHDKSKFYLKIHPAEGGAPFRIEQHGSYAHINTANPDYNHIPFKIPNDKLETYGAVGSLVMGFFEPSGSKTPAELLEIHFEWVTFNVNIFS